MRAPTPIRDPRVEEAVAHAYSTLPDALEWGLERSRHYWVEFTRDEIQKFWPSDGDIDRVRVLFHMDVDVSSPAEALELAKGGQTGRWVYQDYQVFRRSDRFRSKSDLKSINAKRDAIAEQVRQEMEAKRAAEGKPAKPATKPKAKAKPAATPVADAPEPPAAGDGEWDLEE